MTTFEERYAELPWRKFRATCKTQHTRRLDAPWYVHQGNLGSYIVMRSDNSVEAIWKRQALRYAQWYLGERLGRTDVEVGAVWRGDRPYAVVYNRDQNTTTSVPLPAHLDPARLAINAYAEPLDTESVSA